MYRIGGLDTKCASIGEAYSPMPMNRDPIGSYKRISRQEFWLCLPQTQVKPYYAKQKYFVINYANL